MNVATDPAAGVDARRPLKLERARALRRQAREMARIHRVEAQDLRGEFRVKEALEALVLADAYDLEAEMWGELIVHYGGTLS